MRLFHSRTGSAALRRSLVNLPTLPTLHHARLLLALALLSCFVGVRPIMAQGSPPNHLLAMQSEPGDYIGMGQTYKYTPTDGEFVPSARDSNGDGAVDSVTVHFHTPNYEHWWYTNFSTSGLPGGVNLSPGSYQDARRANTPFADGYPGLDVFGDGRGANQVYGRFTIHEASFEPYTDEFGDTRFRVLRFVADFEQHAEVPGAPALRGTVYYNASYNASLSTFTISPTSVVGGNPSTGTVTLSRVVPSDTTITLASSHTAATVPATVTVPSGSTSATFPISTSAVSASTAGQIRATLGDVTLAATLTVKPVSLKTLTLSPTSVVGGSQSSVGTLTLNAPAGPGDILVPLTSSNSAATVPATVTVAAGQTTATFPISTSAVTINTRVSIKATRSGLSKTATLTVKPISVKTLTLSPTSVVGGAGTSTGTVTLDFAPASNLTVTLTSSNPAATVPASVTVPAGSTAATFSISTSAVTASTSVSIKAALHGVTKSAALTVKPIPLVSLSLTPNPAVQGSTITGTVTLQGPAGASGVTVTLTSTNAAVAPVPAIVTIPSGQASATFSFPAGAVTTATSVTIKATAGGVTKSVSLRVNP